MELARLVEALPHRQEPAEHPEHRALGHGEPPRAREDLLLDRRDGRLDRSRAEVERVGEARLRAQLESVLARGARVLEPVAARLLGGPPAAGAGVHDAEGLPGPCQPGLVLQLREQLDGPLRQLAQPLQGVVRLGEAERVGAGEVGAHLDPPVFRRARVVDRAGEDDLGVGELAEVAERLAELGQEREPLRGVGREQRLRPLEEVDGRGQVAVRLRPPPRGRELLGARRVVVHHLVFEALLA